MGGVSPRDCQHLPGRPAVYARNTPALTLPLSRNAFGSALAMFPWLSREDFYGVAVLSLTEKGVENLNPLAPCGVCCSWYTRALSWSCSLRCRILSILTRNRLEKIYEVNPEFRLVTFSDSSLSTVHITTLPSLSSALAMVGQYALAPSHRNHWLKQNHATLSSASLWFDSPPPLAWDVFLVPLQSYSL